MKVPLSFLRQNVLPPLVAFGCALAAVQLGWLERVENLINDSFTRQRATLRPTLAEERLAVIGIDEASLKNFGRWPWSRIRHGDFIQYLRQGKASVVAWDILFTEPSSDPAEDKQFRRGIVLGASSSVAEVVLGAVGTKPPEGILPGDKIMQEARLQPLAKVSGDRTRILTKPAALLPAGQLAQAAHIGFVDTPPDADGVRREAPLIVRIGDAVYPTLSLQSLMKYWQAKPEDVSVILGESVTIQTPQVRRTIPIDETGAYQINYRHDLKGFVVLGYADLFARLQARYTEKQSVAVPPLAGRILLVGQAADGLSDFGPTPFSPLTPLVLVHANVIENVLREDFAKRVPATPVWLAALFMGVAGLWFFAKRKLREMAVYSIGLSLAYTAAAALLWIQWSYWLPVIGPLMGFVSLQVFEVGRRVLVEQTAKQQIKGAFSAYLAPTVVNQLAVSGQMPELGGHDEVITAYFSDIQGFSTFSEKLSSKQLVELLNEYLTACTDIILEEGGTLDKYIGDAVVAMFGAPVALPDHGYRACVAALRVQAKIAELRKKWEGEGNKWPQIVWRMQSRIGLNTGRCTIGNMGSRTRMNYTMMGDDVNLAARMESGAKQWGVYLMCTEETKLSCEKHGGDRVVFRPLGKVVVVGRSAPVPIYELVSLKEHVTERTRECLAKFAEGMERYLARDWDGAENYFIQSAALEPNHAGAASGSKGNPSVIYLERTQRYRSSPPAADWVGVYTMNEK